MGRRAMYVAGEQDPLYLHALQNRFVRTINVAIRRIDPDESSSFNDLPKLESGLCLNVLEYVRDPQATVHNLAQALTPDANLVVLVPQGQGLFSDLDRTLGHQRRFELSELRSLLAAEGFRIDRVYQLNKVGRVLWFVYGRLLGRKQIPKFSLKIYDKTVWLWRRLEKLFPWHGLSVIVIASRNGQPR